MSDQTSGELHTSLRELVAVLERDMGDDFVALALFGSCARGTADSHSDVDLVLIARDLDERLWTRDQHIALLTARVGPPGKSIISLTPEEFRTTFPAYYLDLGLDAVVIHDTGGFLANALHRIRSIIAEIGLERHWLDERRHEYIWQWSGRRPPPGKWAITWEGYHEVA